MTKYKLSASRLREMALQGEDFILEINRVQFCPVYSMTLVPSMGNHIVYQGPRVDQACVGQVIGVRQPHCRVQRLPELHEPKDYVTEDIHESDILTYLIRRTVKNV